MKVYKRNSEKRHSAKRNSVKRHSVKRNSVKRHSAKRNSSRKSSPRRRVKSHYRMRGMGALFSMYGQAGGATEAEAASAKAELEDITRQISMEKSSERREKLEEMKILAQEKYMAAKDKMKNLLRGIAVTASKAASSLSSGAKSIGSNMSSGIKSVESNMSSGIKSVGNNLGEKASSLVDKLKDKYKTFKDNKFDKNYKHTIADIQLKKDFLAQMRAKKSPSPSILSESSYESESELDPSSIVTSEESN